MGHIIDSSTDTPRPEWRVYRMRSGSGRTWQVGPTSSDGSPVTLDHARQIASELGFELVEGDNTPEPRQAWRAACEACGWSTTAETYTAAGEAARAHGGNPSVSRETDGDGCPDASTTVEAVQ